MLLVDQTPSPDLLNARTDVRDGNYPFDTKSHMLSSLEYQNQANNTERPDVQTAIDPTDAASTQLGPASLFETKQQQRRHPPHLVLHLLACC
jgi:hypothetical protein